MYEYFVSLLKKKGVSAYRVSKETGIRKSCFTEWKQGKYKPKADKIFILANYFGVPFESFYTLED